jgi:hypothetical protein
MKLPISRFAAALLITLCVTARPGLAQSSLGSITGLVLDSSGAAMPEAGVVATNSDTGISVRARTNAVGAYNIAALVAGPYEIVVEKPGFQPARRALTLSTGQTVRADIELLVAGVAGQVSVTATIAPLSQESAEVGKIITASEIASLPLNNRTPYAVLGLAPGLSYSVPGNVDAGQVSFNGSRANAAPVTLDGVSTLSISGIPERVGSIESLHEVKVLTSTYSAEHGNSLGGSVELQVKSGTQQYHGTGYWYRRDSNWNAASWLDNALGNTPGKQAQDEFGGALGGPVPGLRKRVFFYTNFERNLSDTAQTSIRTVPDAALRQGDFRGLRNATGQPFQFRDPVLNTTYAGVIPAGRIDPAAARLLRLLPEANAPGFVSPNVAGFTQNNYVRTGSQSDVTSFLTSRTDWHPTDRDRIYATFGYIFERRRELLDFESVLTTRNFNRVRNLYRGVVAYNRIIRPNLTAEVMAAVSQDRRTIVPYFPSFDVRRELGIQNSMGATLPETTIAGAFGRYGESRYNDGRNEPRNAHGLLTGLFGAHTVKAGLQMSQIKEWFDVNEDSAGTYSFSGDVSAGRVPTTDQSIFAFADFLLGAVKTANTPGPQPPLTMVNWSYAAFVQDDWKASRRVTLNLGLRYDLETMPYAENDVYSRIDPLSGRLLVAGRNASRTLDMRTDRFNLAPRFGFAFSINERTVLRGGFGTLFGPQRKDFGQRVQFTGFTSQQAFVDPGVGRPQAFTFSQGAPLPVNPGADPLAAFAAATPARPLPVTNDTYAAAFQRSYTNQWSLGLQRTLPGALVLDAAWVGTKGTKLTRRLPGNNLRLAQSAAVAGGARLQDLRPLPSVGAFDVLLYDANSVYHSFQLRAQRRFANGLSVDANYTLSRTWDTWAPGFPSPTGLTPDAQIPWEIPEARSVSSSDRTHLFGGSGIYQLPFGAGRRYLRQGWTSHLAGGFQVNSTLTAGTGRPLTITQNRLNQVLAVQRPNLAGTADPSGLLTSPAFDNSVRGAKRYLIARRIPDPANPGRLIDNPAFPFAPSGRTDIGNLPRFTLRGPGHWIVNLGLFREFRINERCRAQFRFEAFNALNHVNFTDPNTNIDTANFGLSTGALAPRNLQMAVRFSF